MTSSPPFSLRLLTIRPSDTDPDPDEFLIPDMLHNGIDAFMPAGTPAQADADSAQWQVEVVVDDNQVLQLHFEFTDQAADALAAVIHKGLRFGEDDIMPGNSDLRRFWLGFCCG